MLISRNRLYPYGYILPAIILMVLLTLFPNLYSLYLSFTNYSLYHFEDFQWIGLRNFYRIVTGPEIINFLRVFMWTVLWAGGSVLGSLTIGLVLALILNNPQLKGRNIYRTLFIIPWALPSFITVMMWKGLLNYDFGIINQLLEVWLCLRVPWLSHSSWAKVAVLMVNLWLGFPFMMSISLGALQSIPRELYEASEVDGAGRWKKFSSITLPLLRSALVPVLITSFAFNFNQFNSIYLLTEGGPPVLGSSAGATDILVTYSYKLAFNQFRFGLACAYAVFIFAIVAVLSTINFKITGAFKDVE